MLARLVVYADLPAALPPAPPRALTFPQVVLLLRAVLPQPRFDPQEALARIASYQRHNLAAYFSQRSRTLKTLASQSPYLSLVVVFM